MKLISARDLFPDSILLNENIMIVVLPQSQLTSLGRGIINRGGSKMPRSPIIQA